MRRRMSCGKHAALSRVLPFVSALASLIMASAAVHALDAGHGLKSWRIGLAGRRESLPSHMRLRTLQLRGGAEGSGDAALDERLKALISQAPVMLFMKGEPDAPQCGFSRQIVNLLDENGVRFGFFNILEDEEVRQGLKKFSNWPTYPQVYAHGELLGGLDVCKELAEGGELTNIGYTCKDAEGTQDGDSGAQAPVSSTVLQDKIRAALHASLVEAVDESDGCGAKFSILVVSNKFVGMPYIDRQRAVHEAIKDELPRIHAVTLKCKTEEQYNRQ